MTIAEAFSLLPLIDKSIFWKPRNSRKSWSFRGEIVALCLSEGNLTVHLKDAKYRVIPNYDWRSDKEPSEKTFCQVGKVDIGEDGIYFSSENFKIKIQLTPQEIATLTGS